MSSQTGLATVPHPTSRGSTIKVLSPNPFYRVSYNTPLRELIPPDRKIISVRDTMPVTEILSLLNYHKILSVPVFRADNSCVGSIDVLSIITHILRTAAHTTDLRSESVTRFLAPITAATVLKHSTVRPLVPVFADNPTSMMIDFMATGVHRVALFQKDKEVVATCSQSDLIKFLANVFNTVDTQPNSADIAAAGARLATDTGVFQPVATVPDTASLLSVLHHFAETGRTAMAVVDSEGRLVCDVSTPDLHDLSYAGGFAAAFASLDLPVVEWLKKYSRNTLLPMCTTEDATLRQLVLSLATHRLHRLWVIDSEGRPTHLASLTDVLRVFSSGDVVDGRMASGDTQIHQLWCSDVTEMSP